MATVKNEEDNIIIYGTDLNDNLFNENVNVKIFGYEGNDTIENRGYEVIIEGGAGNDYIYSDVYSRYGSENYRRATIYGGTGNDTIRVNDNETSLNAGAGNDYISVFSGSWENNTLQGGQGNDTIYGGKSNVIIYEEGDGNDTIFCGYSTDTIQIASNRGYTSVRSGNDVIITVGNGSLLLKNPAGIKITTAPKNMNGTNNDDEILNTSSYKTILADAGADILYNIGGRGSKLDGGTGNDFIYNTVSIENFYIESKNTLTNLNDIRKNSHDSSARVLADTKVYYNSVKSDIGNMTDDVVDDLDDIFDKINKIAEGNLTVAEKVDNIIELIEKSGQLNALERIFDDTRYHSDLSQHFTQYINYISSHPNLTVQEKIDKFHSNLPRRSDYFQDVKKIDNIRNSNKSFSNKLKDVDELIDYNGLKPLKALEKSSALAKINVAIAVGDFAENLIANSNDIATALNDAQQTSLFNKWHTFQESFKENAGEESYDKFNISAINFGMTATEIVFGGLATVALVTAGAPVLVAGGIIGGIFYLGNALAKTSYSVSQHSDADGWKSFLKNLNPFDLDDSTYVSKRLMESYSLNVSSVDISIEIITIIGGKGNDTLLNDRCDNVVIDAGDADDMIINQESEKVSISAGNGNDSITNINSSNVTIFGNAGNDLINNNSNSVTINTGDGNNSIVNYMGASISIGAGSGDDYIDNVGNYVTVDAGNGKNIVSNIGAHASLKTSKDDDEISLIGAAGIINAGVGSDYVYSHGDKNTIDTGDGNDSVENFEGSEILITSANGKDYIESFGDSNTINVGQDDDVVNHIGNSSSIDGDSGEDYIEIFGDSNIVNGGNGSDYILVVGDKNSVSAGADNDILEIFGDRNTINSGKGNDFVAIDGSKNIIEYVDGDGNDVIEGFDSQSTLKISDNGYSTIKSGNDVIVKVGNGSISLIGAASIPVNIVGTLLGGNTDEIGKNIENPTSNTLISGTNGNDSIYNYNRNHVTIDAGAGTDYIYNYGGNHIIISGGDDNDSITSTRSNYVTIYGGNGNDSISNAGGRNKSVIIDAGIGDDYIENWVVHYSDDSIGGQSTTIIGGADNDIISLSYAGPHEYQDALIKYKSGDGNDSIYGISYQDTLQITGAKYTTTKSGSDLIVGVGSGKITLVGAANTAFTIEGTLDGGDNSNPLYITGTSGADFIYNSVAGAIIDALAGDDSIKNFYGDLVSINADDGNDYIEIYQSSNITINAGAGNDYIVNDGDSVKIDLGTGDDYIDNFSSYVTINGGNDNDLILNELGNSVSINGGNGDDSITTYGYYSSDIYWYGIYVTVNGGAGDDLISLSNSSGYAEVQYAAGDGNDIIYGINSTDSLKISGAKYSTLKSGSDLKVNVGNGSILLKDAANIAVKIVGTIESGSTTNETLPSGMTLKSSVLTASTAFKGNRINLADYEATKVNASALSQNVTIIGSSAANSIKGSKGADIISGVNGKNTISGGSGNDSILGGSDGDKLLGETGNDTLNGGTGNDTLTGGAGNDLFIYSSGNDLIMDYKTEEDKIKIGTITNSTIKGSDVILTTGNGNLTVKGAKDKVITLVDNSGNATEKIFFAGISYTSLATGLSYDAKRTILTASSKFSGNAIDLGNYLETVTKINASALTKGINIVGNISANSIKGGKGTDTVNGGGGKDTILGGNGNDLIYGGTDNDALKGEAGNDSLYGGTGNDTLTGGAGNDVFAYEGGNDVITDCKVGEDKIKLNLSAITSSTVKGSDVILTTLNGTLTVKGTKDKVVTFFDNNGKTSERIFYGNTSYAPLATGLTYDAKRIVLTASNKFTGSKIDLGEYLPTVTKVNASGVNQGLNIIGNTSANSIKGGKGADTINGGDGKDTILGGTGNDSIYGGNDNDKLQGDAGNDTLNGGTGNDTLTGGAGNDVFVYEGGKDIITDYAAGQDTIKVSGTISKVSYSGKNVIFTIGSGSLTVNNAKGKEISVINSSNKTQTYSRTLEILYDNNFMTDEIGIDEISEVTETNYSVGQIESMESNEKLKISDSIVSASTFAEK